MKKKLKTCPRCLEEKTLDNFHKSANTKDGHFAYCKDCTNEKHRKERPLVLGLRKPRKVVAAETSRMRDVVKYGLELVETFESIQNKDEFYENGVC
jgi:superfamily II helicase